jgi:hypothetical protein
VAQVPGAGVEVEDVRLAGVVDHRRELPDIGADPPAATAGAVEGLEAPRGARVVGVAEVAAAGLVVEDVRLAADQRHRRELPHVAVDAPVAAAGAVEDLEAPRGAGVEGVTEVAALEVVVEGMGPALEVDDGGVGAHRGVGAAPSTALPVERLHPPRGARQPTGDVAGDVAPQLR